MLLFGLTGIKLFTKIVEMPRSVLIPLIMLQSIVGAYAVNNSLSDVYWMLGFGFVITSYSIHYTKLYETPLRSAVRTSLMVIFLISGRTISWLPIPSTAASRPWPKSASL